MRIKTQFLLTIIIFGVVLLVIAASIVQADRQITRLDEQEQTVDGVARGASELGYLANDYILYREPQQRERWETRWAEVSTEASGFAPATPEERAVTRSILQDIQHLKEAFGEVVTAAGGRSGTLASALSSRMAVQSQALAFNALRLARVLDVEKAAVRRRTAQLAVALLAAFAGYLAAMYLIVYKRALRSLAEVSQEMRIIGRGDLDHRIPVRRNDEIGTLTRALNKMTTDLRSVTASKSQLEAEVAEREAAQAALQASMATVEELSDSRQRELEITRRLLEAADRLARWTDLHDVAQEMAELMLQVTSHTRSIVDTFDEQTQEIVVVGSAGVMPFEVGSRWPLEQVSTATRKAIAERRIVMIESDSLESGDRGVAIDPHRIIRMLCVPLIQRDRVVGLLMLDDPGEASEFSEREIELVEGIAAQAAVAIENARLYEVQLSISNRLQEALIVLPEKVPGLEFAHAYHSATESTRVGGDFYDLFEIESGILGITIGDVAGKGLDAAVLTSLVKNSVRAHAHAVGGAPASVLTLTNSVVYKSTTPEAFVTVFFGVLNVLSGRLVYSNAAHTTGAVVGKDGSLRRLASTGPLLGAFGDAAFEQREERLQAGELLFLYTDGLTEARREDVQYGESGLFSRLTESAGQSAHDVVQGVIGEVRQFANDRLRDDLAILALRIPVD